MSCFSLSPCVSCLYLQCPYSIKAKRSPNVILKQKQLLNKCNPKMVLFTDPPWTGLPWENTQNNPLYAKKANKLKPIICGIRKSIKFTQSVAILSSTQRSANRWKQRDDVRAKKQHSAKWKAEREIRTLKTDTHNENELIIVWGNGRHCPIYRRFIGRKSNATAYPLAKVTTPQYNVQRQWRLRM